MVATARLAPKRLLEDRAKIRAFAKATSGVITAIDPIVGEKVWLGLIWSSQSPHALSGPAAAGATTQHCRLQPRTAAQCVLGEIYTCHPCDGLHLEQEVSPLACLCLKLPHLNLPEPLACGVCRSA